MPRQAGRVATLLMALGLAGTAWHGSRATEAPGRVHEAAQLTREQAIALAERRYGARVVRTAVLEQSGRRLYVLRLISSGGKVWTVHIDAASGAEVALP